MLMPSELDAIRDELARELGLSLCVEHPIPPTIDAIAACMPRNFRWEKDHRRWWAGEIGNSRSVFVEVDVTGDEILDRARLAFAAIRANKTRH